VLSLALAELGVDVGVVHWFGNSSMLTAVVGNGGVMQKLSRALKVSIFFFYGRFGLPIPFRVPVVMAIGESISNKKKIENPSKEEFGALHKQVCDGHLELFNMMKRPMGAGYEKKELVIC
jgi:hypothetical protein